MATKKSMWVLFGILVISAWVLGSVTQAGAESLKCKTSGIVVKREVMLLPDVEGHTYNMMMRDGLGFFENGEVATVKSFIMSDVIAGKGVQGNAYQFFSFADGSTIFTSYHSDQESDSEGKFAWLFKLTGEIRKGTGRFEGIKGTISGSGKQFKAEKGDISGKSFADWTFTYTLPSK
jgi:hypothetical protein